MDTVLIKKYIKNKNYFIIEKEITEKLTLQFELIFWICLLYFSCNFKISKYFGKLFNSLLYLLLGSNFIIFIEFGKLFNSKSKNGPMFNSSILSGKFSIKHKLLQSTVKIFIL